MSRNVKWSEEEQVVRQDGDATSTSISNNNSNNNDATQIVTAGFHSSLLPPPTAAATSGLQCPDCGSREIDQQESSGRSVCMECGVVLEENAIAFSVEFVEGAGGVTNMTGKFVSGTSTKAFSGGAGTRMRNGFSRDSRETTLANGRRRIQEIASRLRLHNHMVDAAHRLFTIAVERNFVQGRRTTHVVAACLYIACRKSKTTHMLIDFSDALQVNVYVLGSTFLKFRRLLALQLELIDPALYVHRFAAHLDLDDKANVVAYTALRLAGAMKRDWIAAGRRPAGICAACLLIAARAHGFSRHQTDVTKILRVCGFTVNSRVREFEHTTTANLTLEQFSKVEVNTEADPPSFSRNRIREARARAIQGGDVALLESGALDDPLLGKSAHAWRKNARKSKARDEHDKVYESLQSELTLDTDTPAEAKEGGPESQAIVLHTGVESQNAVVAPGWEKAYPRKSDGRAIILPDVATAEERTTSTVPVEAKLNLDEWKKTIPSEVEEEIDDMFRSEAEELQREAIFNQINKDYIEQQERKEADRLNIESAKADQDKDDAAQAEGHARYKSSRKNKRKKDASTEENLLAVVNSRKISRKINYDALSSLFDDEGNLGGLNAESEANAAPAEDSMYDMLA